jgi:dihydroflavonol-4-reductase
MVYVGTANSFGPGTKENPGTETNPYSSAKYGLGYIDSKYQAHLLVLDAVKQGLPAIIVNPTFMFGPHDSAPSSGAMIVAVYKGKAPGYSPGGKNYVYVKDVAVGICNALTMGRIGESYIPGNENLSYKEAFELIAKQIGAKTPNTRMPKFAVLAFGALSSGIASITGKAPAVSYPMARISCDGHYFSPAKAVTELQLPQTPVADAITEAFNWFKENNKL